MVSLLVVSRMFHVPGPGSAVLGDASGAPAAVVLADELRFLSRIVGRDFLAEAQGMSEPVKGPA